MTMPWIRPTSDPQCIYCGKTFMTFEEAKKLPKGKHVLACMNCGAKMPVVIQ